MSRVNRRFGPRAGTALGLAWLLAAADAAGYERIQTHGRRVWIGPGDVMALTDPERDRVALFDASGERPRSDRVYVADTRGHRVVEFDAGGRSTGLVLGRPGTAPGELGWPCGLAFDADGRTLYVAEEWNARVSAFDVQTGALLFAAGRA